MNDSKGFVLIELFISIAIMIILVMGSLSILYPAVKSAEIGRQRLQAKWILWEEEEAIRQIRNESWANLVPGAGTYFPQYNPTTNAPTIYQGWQLVPGVGVKSGFGTQYQESISITEPYRVNAYQISDTAGSGGTIDPAMRKIICNVSWTSFGQTYTMSLTSYITDWQPF